MPDDASPRRGVAATLAEIDGVLARVAVVRDVDAALDTAPRRLRLHLEIERSASTPLEGRGVLARWDAEADSLRVYSSTQTTTSVRAALAAMLDLADAPVEGIAPDAGGGVGGPALRRDRSHISS